MSPNAQKYQPFRYPGGKSRLAAHPAFRRFVEQSMIRSGSKTFYECFLGSASVTLDFALRHPDWKFVATDADATIAGFWELISYGRSAQIDQLKDLIDQKPTLRLFRELREAKPISLVERAYYAIFFNRTTFSGIATSQPIGGFTQKSKYPIDCRYNKKALKSQIDGLRGLFAGRLTVSNEDCISWLKKIPASACCYLDPPYFVKGKELYPVSMEPQRHADLASILCDRVNWIMSYDVSDEIDRFYDWCECCLVTYRYSINGEKKKWKTKKEYLITPKGFDVESLRNIMVR